MIADNIKNIERYIDLIPLFRKAEERICELSGVDNGKVEIEGNKLFACVQSVVTDEIENCPNENHRRYIDIHYVIKGRERIDYWKRSDSEVTKAFDVENDYELCSSPDNYSSVVLNEGDFALVYPGEVHRSKVCIEEPEPLHKIVFKLEY